MTLIEVMVAAAVLMIGIVAVAGLVDGSNKSTSRVRETQTATNLARELVEAARGLSYASIAEGTVLTAIGANDAALADSTPGNPHTITRNNVTYTVTSKVCIMDDARDGGGSHSGGNFCPDSAAETAKHPLSGQSDVVPEDYKRVIVTTTWKSLGLARERSVTQTTLVNNPGSAGAPAVQTLTATNPSLGSPPAQVTSATSIDFALTTSSTPWQVKWLLDGAGQGLAVGSGKAWGFSWSLGAIGAAGSAGDGPYLVSAEAYDQYGVSGASRSMTITLNRSAPAAPKGVAGGINGSIIEMEWLPNAERDLAGYQVFRCGTSTSCTTRTLVCALSFATTCTDAGASSGGDKLYQVVAYDKDSTGVLRAGGTAQLTIVSGNTAPKTPDNVKVTYSNDGAATATLTWNKPSPVEDVDDNVQTTVKEDYIAFYRIYRDGITPAHRYAKVDATGTSHSYDDWINGTKHDYYISAVDTRYGESNLIGPVR